MKDVLPAETPHSRCLVSGGQPEATCSAGTGGLLLVTVVLRQSNQKGLYMNSVRGGQV